VIKIQLSHIERQLAHAVAKNKTDDSEGFSSTIKMKPGFDYFGTCGEIAFANYMEIDWDWRSHKSGDGGIDFTIGENTVDVKSTQGEMHNRHLCVDECKVRADIYVQTLHSPHVDGLITLVGWAWANEVLSVPARKPEGWYNSNHMVDHTDLHEMHLLRRD
jgi:hypothetical protein